MWFYRNSVYTACRDMSDPVTTYVQKGHLVCQIQEDALNIFNFSVISSRCSDAMVTNGSSSVILDMTKVDMIDSVGVGLLVRLRKTIEEKGAKFSICGISPGVDQVFKLFDFHRQFNIYPTVKDAAG